MERNIPYRRKLHRILNAMNVVAGTMVFTALASSVTVAGNHSIGQPVWSETMGSRLHFEPNWGQADPKTLFLSRSGRLTVLLGKDEVSLTQAPAKPSLTSPRVRWRLVNASLSSKVQPEVRMPGVTNYLLGNRPDRWIRGVPNYARIRYKEVYPGVDLLYYRSLGSLEFDFVVAPNANPAGIGLEISEISEGPGCMDPAFHGHNRPAQPKSLTVAANGDLVLVYPGGELRWRKPQAYQMVNGTRRVVEARFLLQGNKHVGFALGPYDKGRQLVIDPVLSFSSYWGGTGNESALGIASDQEGNIYVTGVTSSSKLLGMDPQTGKVGPLHGAEDAFVAKLSPSGVPIYATFLGGSGKDIGLGIAVDSANNAYILGGTHSADFPVTPGSLQPVLQGSSDFFVAKLNSSGNTLVFSTFLGGSGTGEVEGNEGGIALDKEGSIYVTGSTNSRDFPVTPNAFQISYGLGDSDAFVAKIGTDGKALIYATYLGGSGLDKGRSIALDANGSVYVTGRTLSRDFPTINGVQMARSGASADAFVVRLDPTGSLLLYATYLGGELDDDGYGIAAIDDEHVYVVGETYSTRFPVTDNAYKNQTDRDNEITANADIFVSMLDTTQTGTASLLYSSFLGGSTDDFARAMTLNSAGNMLVTGITLSADFPVKDAIQTSLGGGGDAFLVKFNPQAQISSDSIVPPSTDTSTALVYSTYLGGSGSDQGLAVTVDREGQVWVAGETESTDFPLAQPSQTKLIGSSDAFLARVAYGTGGPANLVVTSGITVTPSSPYETSQELVGQFTIANLGGFPIGLKHLTLANMTSGTALPDFTWESDSALDPGESHQYTGSLTLTAAGSFDFQAAYMDTNGKWHTGLAAQEGASSQVTIIVDQQASGTVSANSISSSSENDQCTILFGGRFCSTSITWTGVNVTKDEVKVYVQDVGAGAAPELFQDQEISGSRVFDKIEGSPHQYRFSLNQERDGIRTELASVDVTGQEADPPTTASNYIRAVPNVCVIPAGSNTCSAELSWAASSGVTQARVYVQDVGAGSDPAAFSEPDSSSDTLNVSGELPASWIRAAPHRYVFTLYQMDSSDLPSKRLAAVEVTGKTLNGPSNASGALTVRPLSQIEPCCAAVVAWDTRDNVRDARVVYEDVDSNDGPRLLARTKSGTATATELVAGHRYLFTLYQVDAELLVVLATAKTIVVE